MMVRIRTKRRVQRFRPILSIGVGAARESQLDQIRPIKMGIAIALSGRYALLGRQVLAGLECFVEDVNAVGGIYVERETSRLVELIVRDDASDPICCGQRVCELIEQQQIDVLIGPYGSGSTMAAAAVAERAEMVLFNHSGSADEIFRADFRWLVGIITPASNYLSAVLELLRATDPSAKRIALVSANTGFAVDVASGIEAWVKSAGYDLCCHQRYRSGLADFREMLADTAERAPDCLLGVGRIEDDLNLARAISESAFSVNAVGLVVAGIEQFRQELGAAAEGFLGPSQWEAGAQFRPSCGPTGKAFLRRFREYYGAPADYPAAQGYVGGLIAQQCIEHAGTLKQTALREAANRISPTTFYGRYEIDGQTGRQLAHQVLVTQWQAGAKRIVWPRAAADGEIHYPRAMSGN